MLLGFDVSDSIRLDEVANFTELIIKNNAFALTEQNVEHLLLTNIMITLI